MRARSPIVGALVILAGCGGGGGHGGFAASTIAGSTSSVAPTTSIASGSAPIASGQSPSPPPTPPPNPNPPPPTPPPASKLQVAAWLPYWEIAPGQKTVRDVVGHALDEVDCFSYGTKPDGSLSILAGARDAAFIADVHRGGGKALMTVTGVAGSSILGQASRTTTFIQNVLDETTKYDFDGADLDWESLTSGERADFSAMCEQLAKALHAKKKTLSITVIAKTQDHVSWGAADALDFKALGKCADGFKMMTYGYSGAWSRRAGPIGPLSWDETCVKFAESEGVAKSKILLGVPFYGYDWPQNATSPIKSVTWSTAQPLIMKSTAGVIFDAKLGEAHFSYADATGLQHVVWFQNDKAIAAKAELAKKLGIAGVCCWAIGGEARAFWTALEKAKK